jgi:hypothetical protein
MNKYEKLYNLILLGQSDSNINFDELCHLLEKLGFIKRTKGSHNIFKKIGIDTNLNLQNDGNKAKKYQVKQVRNLILENNLRLENE